MVVGALAMGGAIGCTPGEGTEGEGETENGSTGGTGNASMSSTGADETAGPATGSDKVLRGGSWATSRIAIRNSFRNWDHPERRQIFSGFRCARDA